MVLYKLIHDMLKWLTAFCLKAPIFVCCLDHLILFQFRQLVVNIIIMELQVVFGLLLLAIAIESLNAKFGVKS